jgi:hypothetical protein
MNYNEADTRAKLIDPAIHKRGWIEDFIRREVTAGASRSSAASRAGAAGAEWTIRSAPGPSGTESLENPHILPPHSYLKENWPSLTHLDRLQWYKYNPFEPTSYDASTS